MLGHGLVEAGRAADDDGGLPYLELRSVRRLVSRVLHLAQCFKIADILLERLIFQLERYDSRVERVNVVAGPRALIMLLVVVRGTA